MDLGVSSKAQSNEAEGNAEKALRAAIEAGNLEAFNESLALLFNQPLPGDECLRLSTLLHSACKWRRAEMLEKLAGNALLDLSAVNECQLTALDVAVRDGYEECVDVLLRNRLTRGTARLLQPPSFHETNLWFVANQCGLLNVVRLLTYEDDDEPPAQRFLSPEAEVMCLVTAIGAARAELVDFWLAERNTDANIFVHDSRINESICPLWACADG